MRTLLRVGACAAILSLFPAPGSAQGILDRIKKKAADAIQQKAEEKVNNKIDELSQQMVDKSFATVFGDSSSPAGGNGGGATGGNGRGAVPFSFGSSAKTESAYAFNVVTTTEITSSKRADAKTVLLMHFNTSEPYTATSISLADGKQPETTPIIILDAKNQAMVMLMASEKSKFSIAYDWKEAQRYAQSQTATKRVDWDTVKVWNSYAKIGTRTIAGYAAEGYRSESPEATMELWVSRDAKLGTGTMFAANSSLKQLRGRLPAEYPQGFLLELNSTNKKSTEQVTMRVTNIDTNAHIAFSMSDYPKMEMGKK